jgi:dTDP-4-amino-4,6-dideoxygalactose transaminase
MKIPLIKPYIDNSIKEKVLEVLDSGILTEGNVTREFENKFKDYIGTKYSIAVTSCTTGLEIALRAAGIGNGDEVIVPDFTYPATASVVNIVGAVPVIVDVSRETMLISYDDIEKAITPKTKAIIPVSIFGNPLDYNKLNKIKNNNGLIIIEDAACSIGAEYFNKKVGTLADISVFSLHPRKFITTGEGGLITTDNENYAEWIQSYKHFGMNMNNENVREGITFEIIGTNYKLSNVLSAIGLGQLNIINELLMKRINLAENYNEYLGKHSEIRIPSYETGAKHSYQSYCIYVEKRDKIMKIMRSNGIEVQIGTYSLHMHDAFRKNSKVKLAGNFDNSKYAYEHCLTLPLYHELSFEQQEYIVKILIETINNI